ncbi:hypothetical protein FOB63_004723 [Clavispora lusitaniae]|uniref:F-box domain-containing protein n=1 Tax=Clavispora lusitaniae TaxID=36911 RepID=A0AA91PXX9_CLALS|nr:hypothetical protein FOB63_004723 [Clavispora lusitaniae]OVF07604.1 hypothetical protein A9F13_12g01474 [Clavispora lusitaniae]
MASLLLLPDELLCRVVFHLTDGILVLESKRRESRFPRQEKPHHTYSSIRNRLRNHVSDVLSLSSTCSRLRRLCGSALFGFTSLIRSSEIDSILSYPRRMDRWSNSTLITDEFWSLLQEHASESLKMSTFVDDLEIDNRFLEHLDKFRNLHSLKVLDIPYTGPVLSIPILGSVVCLSINAETLLRLQDNVFPSLERLDLITDIHALEPDQDLNRLAKNVSTVTTLNLFVTEVNILRYEAILSFVTSVMENDELEHFALRAVRKKGQRAQPRFWNVAHNSGSKFIDSLCSQELQTFTIDYEFLSNLEFSQQETEGNPHRQLERFTLVDSVLALPKIDQSQSRLIGRVIQSLQPKEFAFAYGEVIAQSHFQAFAGIQAFLSTLEYCNIRIVSLEKVWSMVDDSLVRKYYEELVETYDRSSGKDRKLLKQKIAAVSLTEKLSFSTPRYHNREYYELAYTPEPSLSPYNANETSPDDFWAVESSLRDLEHYCLKEKALSSIWD